jgi:hypothetical protein
LFCFQHQPFTLRLHNILSLDLSPFSVNKSAEFPIKLHPYLSYGIHIPVYTTWYVYSSIQATVTFLQQLTVAPVPTQPPLFHISIRKPYHPPEKLLFYSRSHSMLIFTPHAPTSPLFLPITDSFTSASLFLSSCVPFSFLFPPFYFPFFIFFSQMTLTDISPYPHPCSS